MLLAAMESDGSADREVESLFNYRGVATCTQIRNCVPENNNKNK